MKRRFLIIVRAADREQANDLAKGYFDAAGGERTFTVPLFAAAAEDDSEPTHYVASADVSPENVPLLMFLRGQFPGSEVLEYSLDADAFYGETLAGLGLRIARPAGLA